MDSLQKSNIFQQRKQGKQQVMDGELVVEHH